jgi:YgiT-type zinc finger domain-containing protein
MITKTSKENLVEKSVTYTLLKDGHFFIVENVPARVNEQTGKQFFSPQTVEHLQKIILEHNRPVRTIETPVFEYV